MYIHVDSLNRDSNLYPYGNSYVLNLTTRLNSVTSIELISASVPNTIYNITNGSNVFTFNSNLYSINTGYYAAPDLAAAISATTGGSLNVSYQSGFGKFIFYANSTFTLQVNTYEMSQVTGMANATVYSSVLGSTNRVYAQDPTYSTKYLVLPSSLTTMVLNKNQSIYLDIAEFRSPSIIDAKANNYGTSYPVAPPVGGGTTISPVVVSTSGGLNIEGVSGIIPLDVPSGTVKVFKAKTECSLPIKFPTPLMNINKLTVRWLDYTGAVVNFNGYDHNNFVLIVNQEETKG
jgi:hypothetical protein